MKIIMQPGQDDIGNKTLEIIKINDKVRDTLILNRKETLDCFLEKRDSIIEWLGIIIKDITVNISIKRFVKREAQKFIEEVKENSKHGKPYCTMIKHNSADLIEEVNEILLTPIFAKI